MHPLPREGWAREQVTYLWLIRPVVAFVRDHGPVPAERVLHVITSEAPGDLNLASPTKDRADAAHRVLNLMSNDIVELTVHDSMVSVSAGVTGVTSALLNEKVDVPTADVLEADRNSSREQRTLREWVGKGLFATKWRNGVRDYKKEPEKIAWMVKQIQTFGYVGPMVVRDAKTGSIIDGGLRAAALDELGMSLDEHSTWIAFENDSHRLAYVIAAHTVPGKKGNPRVPVSLRKAVLKEVLPRNTKILRGSSGEATEPTDDQWLAIHWRDFVDEPSMSQPMSAEPTEQVPAEPASAKNPDDSSIMDLSDEVLADKILAVMNPEDFVDSKTVSGELRATGAGATRIDRAMRTMVKAHRLEERVSSDRTTVYRPRLIAIPRTPQPPVVKEPAKVQTRAVLPDHLEYLKHHGVRILVDLAQDNPGQWIKGTDLDVLTAIRMKSRKDQLRSSHAIVGRPANLGPHLWTVDGKDWQIEVKKDSVYELRAMPG